MFSNKKKISQEELENMFDEADDLLINQENYYEAVSTHN